MDNEDGVSDREVFHRAADPPPPLLHKEVIERGALHVGNPPIELRETSLVLPVINIARIDRRPPAPASSAGNALYLASIALIAITIAGIFFGAGYSLLAPPTRAAASSSGNPNQRAAAHEPKPTPRPALSSSISGDVAAVALAPAAPLPVAGHTASPAGQPLSEASAAPTPVIDDSHAEEAPARSRSSAGPVHEAPGEPSASFKTPPASAVPDWPASKPNLSGAEISDLVKHGDAFLSIGDLASARLFYERAASAGDGRAALRLGATFDPDFLDRAGLRSVKGDPAMARSWYSRALDLGAPEAKRQLNGLNSQQLPEPR